MYYLYILENQPKNMLFQNILWLTPKYTKKFKSGASSASSLEGGVRGTLDFLQISSTERSNLSLFFPFQISYFIVENLFLPLRA